jgi:phosphomannomutase
VLLPELHLGRDAPLAAALILCFLDTSEVQIVLVCPWPHAAHHGVLWLQSVKAAMAVLPQYHIVKLKGSVPEHWDRIIQHLIAEYRSQGAQLSMADGVRIDTKVGPGLCPFTFPTLAFLHIIHIWLSIALILIPIFTCLIFAPKEGWVHLRKSNTEPIYRVIGEFGADAATSQQKCQAVIDEVNRLNALFSK